MKTVLAVLGAAVLFAGLPASSQEKQEGGAVTAYLVTADGFEVAKALDADRKKASKDYSPTRPPRGVAGGRIVNINGTVARVEKDKIQLASGNEWNILLKPKGKVEGAGPYVSITVASIALATDGTKLALIEGEVTRSETPLLHALGGKKE